MLVACYNPVLLFNWNLNIFHCGCLSQKKKERNKKEISLVCCFVFSWDQLGELFRLFVEKPIWKFKFGILKQKEEQNDFGLIVWEWTEGKCWESIIIIYSLLFTISNRDSSKWIEIFLFLWTLFCWCEILRWCRDNNWIAASKIISWCRFIKSSNLEMQIQSDISVRKPRSGVRKTGRQMSACQTERKKKLNNFFFWQIN